MFEIIKLTSMIRLLTGPIITWSNHHVLNLQNMEFK